MRKIVETQPQVCAHCGKQTEELFETGFGDDQYCKECIEQNEMVECDGCGRWFDYCEIEETPAGEMVCDSCRSSYSLLDFVGDCRYMAGCIDDFFPVYFDEDFEAEVRGKLESLVKAYRGGDAEARATLLQCLQDFDAESAPGELEENALRELISDDPNRELPDDVSDIADDFLGDGTICRTLQALGYDVDYDAVYEGPHGHGGAAVYYVK